MINSDELEKIKEAVENFLQKMTITDFTVDSKLSFTPLEIMPGRSGVKSPPKVIQVGDNILSEFTTNKEIQLEEKQNLDVVNLDINIKEPQILIGSNGQTLFELQRILGIILNKKLKKSFYLNLDINDYEKKKVEYLKNLVKNLADEVFLTKKKKILSPMPAYQRRIVHIELAGRTDIITESQGSGIDRCVVISPR